MFVVQLKNLIFRELLSILKNIIRNRLHDPFFKFAFSHIKNLLTISDSSLLLLFALPLVKVDVSF